MSRNFGGYGSSRTPGFSGQYGSRNSFGDFGGNSRNSFASDTFRGLIGQDYRGSSMGLQMRDYGTSSFSRDRMSDTGSRDPDYRSSSSRGLDDMMRYENMRQESVSRYRDDYIRSGAQYDPYSSRYRDAGGRYDDDPLESRSTDRSRDSDRYAGYDERRESASSARGIPERESRPYGGRPDSQSRHDLWEFLRGGSGQGSGYGDEEHRTKSSRKRTYSESEVIYPYEIEKVD